MLNGSKNFVLHLNTELVNLFGVNDPTFYSFIPKCMPEIIKNMYI